MATNATALTPPTSIASIAPAGGVETALVRLRIADSIPCETPVVVDIDLVGMATRWGPLSPASDELAACDITTPGPGEPCLLCEPPCKADAIQPIARVLAVKAGAGLADVALSWTQTADANVESYNTWRLAGAVNKPAIPSAREGQDRPAPGRCQAWVSA